MGELSVPSSRWPLLLCGPILRRVTPDSVSVFIATSKACSVRLLVRDSASRATWVGASAVLPTRQIGQRLHVLVITLDGQSFQPGKVYEYDVEMTPASTGKQTLADQAGLLSGPLALGYTVGALPSFSLAPDLPTTRILHGSCRKPHGGGPDALTIADDLIRASYDNSVGNANLFAISRPHLLLLTGDQIYADDVSAGVLQSLRSAASELMGSFSEVFPPGQLGWDASALQPGERRAAWLKAHSQLTSEHLDNHLMFLGEFYAMYLFAWSDVLWPKGDWDKTFLHEDTLFPSLSDAHVPKATKKQLEGVLKAEKKALVEAASYAGDTTRVRRALANVPTMMAFDDHEVSDDWNIDGLWNAKARSDPALNRIVRNGLAAYTVFQAWGNTPDRFRGGTASDLLDALTKPAARAVPDALADPPAPAVATLLDVGPAAAANADRVLWDWTLDSPGVRVIALDSRTHRDFSNTRHTGLLTPSEMTRQLAANKPAANDPRLCFVIAPAPVIGHPLVEEIAQPLSAALKGPVAGTRAADLEAWSANQDCLQRLLSTLAGFGSVVLLSGDVHYAYTNQTAYHGPSGSGVHARIVQLCSSAQKNTDDMTKVIQAAGYAGFELRGRGWFGTSRQPPALAKDDILADPPAPTSAHPWDAIQLINIIDAVGRSHSLALLAKGAAVGAALQDVVADKFLVRAYWLLTVPRLDETPLVLPNGPWFSAATLGKVQAIVGRDPANPDPTAWSYQTEYARDERDDSDRCTVVAPWYLPLSGMANSANRQIIAQARYVVGMPNIGDISIRMTTGATPRPKEVVHHLHWLLPDRTRVMTEHKVTVSPPVSPSGIVDQVPALYQ
jgi:hypothetical protein